MWCMQTCQSISSLQQCCQGNFIITVYECIFFRIVSLVIVFNLKVLETRKGRCGEYSVLMMLFLNALKYETRWVVDRDDHVSKLVVASIVSFL